MSQVDQTAVTTDRTPDFRRMLLALKQKYAESAEQISELKAAIIRVQKNSGYLEEENNSLQEQLATLKNILQQTQESSAKSKEEYDHVLERLQATDVMREALEQENTELRSLRDELEFLRIKAQASQHKADELSEILSSVQEQNQRNKQRIEKLTQENQEKDKRILEIEQFQNNMKQSQEHMNELEGALEHDKHEIQALADEKTQLQQALEESKRHSEQLERVIQFLREKAESAHLESKQLQTDFMASQETIAALTQQLKTVQEEAIEFSKNFGTEHRDKLVMQEELKALQSQFEGLKNRVVNAQHNLQTKDEVLRATNEKMDALLIEKQTLERLLSEKAHALEEFEKKIEILREGLEENHKRECESFREEIRGLRDQINDACSKENDLKHKLEVASQVEAERQQLLQDKHKLEQELIAAKGSQDEQEMRIKMAQQHLAKKLKETAFLNEKIEEQRIQLIELQNSMTHAKVKNEELTNSLEQQLQQDRRMQEQVKEIMKSAEAQVNKWEEKYFALCDKWQETEARNKELRAIEEKFNQMQALLTNLSAFVGSPFNLGQNMPNMQHLPTPQMTPQMPVQPKISTPAPTPVVEQLSRSAHQDLFDLKALKPAKQNLFD